MLVLEAALRGILARHSRRRSGRVRGSQQHITNEKHWAVGKVEEKTPTRGTYLAFHIEIVVGRTVERGWGEMWMG